MKLLTILTLSFLLTEFISEAKTLDCKKSEHLKICKWKNRGKYLMKKRGRK